MYFPISAIPTLGVVFLVAWLFSRHHSGRIRKTSSPGRITAPFEEVLTVKTEKRQLPLFHPTAGKTWSLGSLFSPSVTNTTGTIIRPASSKKDFTTPINTYEYGHTKAVATPPSEPPAAYIISARTGPPPDMLRPGVENSGSIRESPIPDVIPSSSLAPVSITPQNQSSGRNFGKGGSGGGGYPTDRLALQPVPPMVQRIFCMRNWW